MNQKTPPMGEVLDQNMQDLSELFTVQGDPDMTWIMTTDELVCGMEEAVAQLPSGQPFLAVDHQELAALLAPVTFELGELEVDDLVPIP